jgi:hypothetical protein
MRRDGISRSVIESIVAYPDGTRVDVSGNVVVMGGDTRGRPIEIVA